MREWDIYLTNEVAEWLERLQAVDRASADWSTTRSMR
jgi:hypothetical protein